MVEKIPKIGSALQLLIKHHGGAEIGKLTTVGYGSTVGQQTMQCGSNLNFVFSVSLRGRGGRGKRVKYI